MSLPPTDLAYGQTIWEAWSSPVEGTTASIFAILGAAIGFPFALGFLWKSNLYILNAYLGRAPKGVQEKHSIRKGISEEDLQKAFKE
jgi:hypothetical protein